jgi:hypothetical protein
MDKQILTIKDVITEGNKLLENFEQYKVYNHNDFHKKVEELLKPFINSLGLDFNLWYIGILGEKILVYTRTFSEYKNGRYALKRQGTFSDVHLKTCSIVYDDISLKNLPLFIKKLQHQARLNNANNWVAKAEEELKEAKKNLEKIKNEITL